MEKLVKEEKLYWNENCYLEMLYIKNEQEHYLDIYNVDKQFSYYIGRIDVSSFVNNVAFEINSKYFFVFGYEPIIGTDKRYVTKVFKFYDLNDNINIVDSIKNLVLKFNNNALLYNPFERDHNRYLYDSVSLKIRTKMLKTMLVSDLNLYIENLKNNTYGTKSKEKNKIIDISNYLNDSPKILSLGGITND